MFRCCNCFAQYATLFAAKFCCLALVASLLAVRQNARTSASLASSVGSSFEARARPATDAASPASARAIAS